MPPTRKKRSEPPKPGLRSEGPELRTWLTHMGNQHPNGPELFTKPVPFKNSRAKAKAKLHGYIKGTDQILTGICDAKDYSTIPEFTRHITDGKALLIELFAHTTAKASDPSGHNEPENTTRITKAFNHHAWVAVIGKREAGSKALYIFDSDLAKHPVQPSEGKKKVLSATQHHLHLECKERGIQHVFIWSPGYADGRCAFHSARFITNLMKKKDSTIQDEDERFSKFIYLENA